MVEMVQGKARICVVNYKTPQLIRVCLRAIRKFTDYPYEVVVVDNDSKDESVEYLRSLNWIHLIERRPEPGSPRGSFDEGSAYDLGLADCRTEFFVVMHSDTIALRPGWLTELLGCFRADPHVACVGSDKIESGPQWRIAMKKATDYKTLMRKLFGKPDPLGRYRYHNRTICCAYRTDILQSEKLSFLADYDKGFTTGKRLYLELVDRGYETVELPLPAMRRLVAHLTHATQIANPDEFPLGRRAYKKWNRFIANQLDTEPIRSLLADASLDR